MNRRQREQQEKLAREMNVDSDTGGTLMRGTRTHKSPTDYNRKAEKRVLRQWENYL